MRFFLDFFREIKDRFFDFSLSDHKFLKQIKNFSLTANFPILTSLNLPKNKLKIIDQANKILDHKFIIFGSNLTVLNKEINWQQDFINHYEWSPKTYYKKIKIPYDRGDIKVPWELSRCQHLILLGQAYAISHDEKYTAEFISEISDWIASNKPKFGVNWSCTMDVAIRSVNWITAYSFFKKSPLINQEFSILFTKNLYIHGQYIMANLEYSKTLTSNHYLSDLVGLLYIAFFLPKFNSTEKWQRFAISEIKREMEKQVYQDGCDFEASACYHRLVTELFFYAAYFAIINDAKFLGSNYYEILKKIFGEKYCSKLHKMFSALLFLTKPNGEITQIGDNDSGRLLIFSERSILDMRYLLNIGAVFFNEKKFKIAEFIDPADVGWVFGDHGLKIYHNLATAQISEIASQRFDNTGWYVLRQNNNYLSLSCGNNGQKNNGGHAHNDKLSFELTYEKANIIVDPGTNVYTSNTAKRNLFRSTAYHNTVVIDQVEQNILPDSLFSLTNNTHAKIVQFTEAKQSDTVIGEHYGYQRLSDPVKHRREIKFQKENFLVIIKDKFIGQGKHQANWYFHLAPEIIIKILSTHKISLLINEKIIFFNFDQRVDFKIINGLYSPAYGQTVNNKIISCFTSIDCSRSEPDYLFEIYEKR